MCPSGWTPSSNRDQQLHLFLKVVLKHVLNKFLQLELSNEKGNMQAHEAVSTKILQCGRVVLISPTNVDKLT